MFEAIWTGHYPCLCYGEWQIKKNGVDVSKYIPEELLKDCMNTAGEYSMWYFADDWQEEFEYYIDGLECEEWIEKNPWISAICDNHNEMVELYHAIQENDWRSGSCGGCI